MNSSHPSLGAVCRNQLPQSSGVICRSSTDWKLCPSKYRWHRIKMAPSPAGRSVVVGRWQFRCRWFGVRIGWRDHAPGGGGMVGGSVGADRQVSTFCPLCVSRCGATATISDGALVALAPDPAHPTGQALCTKGKAAPELVHHRERLLYPLMRTNPKERWIRAGGGLAGRKRWTLLPRD